MNSFIKSWLDYKEYIYYYKVILVTMLGVTIEKSINNNLMDIPASIIEFLGIKYWVFKNKWENKKNLKREIFLFSILKVLFYVLSIILPSKGYWKLFYDRINNPVRKKVLQIINKLKKYMNKNKILYKINIRELVENIIDILIIFLSTSVIAYPAYRYLIFTPQ